MVYIPKIWNISIFWEYCYSTADPQRLKLNRLPLPVFPIEITLKRYCTL